MIRGILVFSHGKRKASFRYKGVVILLTRENGRETESEEGREKVREGKKRRGRGKVREVEKRKVRKGERRKGREGNGK